MSVIITISVPEGIVMAADSRLISNDPPHISSDQATKLFKLDSLQAGVAIAGPIFTSDGFAAASVIREVDDSKPPDIEMAAGLLATRFQQTGQAFALHVAGYENKQRLVYRTVFEPPIGAKTSKSTGSVLFADGDYEIIKLITDYIKSHGWCVATTPLLDAIDLASLLAHSQIEFSRFIERLSPAGGPVDVFVLTPSNASFYTHKAPKLLSPGE